MGAPRLRVFDPTTNQPQEQHDDQISLRKAFTRYKLPDMKQGPDATASAYRTALKHWEQKTSNPPLSEIDDDTLRQFRDGMITDPTITSGATIRKNWAHLRAILNTVGPRGHRNPSGRGVINYVPYLDLTKLDKVRRKRTRVIPHDEINAIFSACRVASIPRNTITPPPLIWRAVFVLAYNYGLRTRDLLLLRSTSLSFSERCPDPDIPIKNEHGWLSFIPQKTRNSKPEPLILPLTSICSRYLKSLTPHRGLVFGFTKSSREWNEQRHQIQAAAGIARPYGFVDFRKTCNMAWNGLQPGLGNHALGHAGRDVNERHYTEAIGWLAAKCDQLPQPDAFVEGLQQIPAPGQLGLF